VCIVLTISYSTCIHALQNPLDGEIPSSLFNCLGLRKLNLANTNLEGQLPDELCRLADLEE
jgi:hypothetical protein